MSDEDDILIKFDPGDSIFSQGDPGGDLFFIKEGQVEIYTKYEDKEVTLSVMTPGEVIGTLTCMTQDERLASARAKSPVTVKHVSHEKISRLLSKLPNWMHIVLKDFINRLQNMNKQFSESVNKLDLLEKNQADLLYTSAQLASGIANCAEEKHVLLDDIPGLLPDMILDYLQPILLREKEELEKIFSIFVDSGMIDLKIEQEKKRKFFTVENAIKIQDFCEFVSQSNRKKIRRLIESKFTNREIRVIAGLLRFVEVRTPKAQGVASFTVAELDKNLEKKTGQKFELDALKQAELLKMISIEGQKENMKVVFTPKNVSHILAHLKAYRKILAIDKSLM